MIGLPAKLADGRPRRGSRRRPGRGPGVGGRTVGLGPRRRPTVDLAVPAEARRRRAGRTASRPSMVGERRATRSTTTLSGRVEPGAGGHVEGSVAEEGVRIGLQADGEVAVVDRRPSCRRGRCSSTAKWGWRRS